MENLLRLSKAKDDPRVPFKNSTLYKWHHTKKYPGLFVKFGGTLFIDLGMLGKIAEAGRQK